VSGWIAGSRRIVVVAATLAACVVGAKGDEANAEKLRALVQSGDYHQAYETVASADPAHRTVALEELARTLLTVTVLGDNTYMRWDALQASLPLKDPAVAAAARRHATAEDRYERSLVLEVLGNVDPAGSRAQLLSGLDSPFRAVRLRALEGLARLKDPALMERLAKVLSGDSDPDLRALAARAVGGTGAPTAIPMLHRALDDPQPVVQEEAVRGLVALHDPDLSNIMRRRLADNPQERRVATIRLAGLVPDPGLIDDLGPYLGDADPRVRAFAAASILAIQERRVAGTP
jgi:HEAT repeat protein